MLNHAREAAEAEPSRGPWSKPMISGGSKLTELAHHHVQKAIEGVAVWRERRALARELTELDDAALADLGLVRGQIPILVRAHPAAGNQLDRMLKHLGLESTEIPLEAGMREDLYRVCVQCTERKRCQRWFDSASTESQEGYKAFCPNARMFDLLRHRLAEMQAHRPTTH